MSNFLHHLASRSLAAFCLAWLAGCSTTVLTASCDKPKVSNSSVPFVYLVMLPYSYTELGIPKPSNKVAVEALNDVARLQVVRMGAETSDMHVTLLDAGDKRCDIERVYREFTETKFFERNLRSTVVFFWGDIYGVDDRVLVRSHLRTLWKNPKENLINIYVDLPGSRENLLFTGWAPYSTVSFPGRDLPVGKTLSPGDELRKSLQARSTPQSDSLIALPKKFSIQQRKGNWVELQEFGTANTVWIEVTDPGTNAKPLLPELSFAHAMSAYASFNRVANPEIGKDTIRWLEEFRSGYRSADLDDELAPSIAIADIVEAMTRMKLSWASNERQLAEQLIEKAVATLPTSSAVLNLAAVLQVEKCCVTKEMTSRVQQRFETARSLDVGNEIIAKNLLNWYRLLEEKDPAVLPRSKEETRILADQLAEALGKISNPAPTAIP